LAKAHGLKVESLDDYLSVLDRLFRFAKEKPGTEPGWVGARRDRRGPEAPRHRAARPADPVGTDGRGGMTARRPDGGTAGAGGCPPQRPPSFGVGAAAARWGLVVEVDRDPLDPVAGHLPRRVVDTHGPRGGPSTLWSIRPKRAGRPFDASVDHTDARSVAGCGTDDCAE
jgi:hypothetical protein